MLHNTRVVVAILYNYTRVRLAMLSIFNYRRLPNFPSRPMPSSNCILLYKLFDVINDKGSYLRHTTSVNLSLDHRSPSL